MEKQHAIRELGWETRDLAANLLRVIRGAGRPHELPQQIINLSGAILEVHKTVRAWAIWSAMQETLASGIPDWFDAPDSTAYESTIAQGALQLVASRLLHQSAQEARGSSQIDEGIREMEAMRERIRARRAEEQAQSRAKAHGRRTVKPSARKKSGKRSAQPGSTKSASAVTKEPERVASTAEFMKARQRELRGEESPTDQQ